MISRVVCALKKLFGLAEREQPIPMYVKTLADLILYENSPMDFEQEE